MNGEKGKEIFGELLYENNNNNNYYYHYYHLNHVIL